MKQENLLNEQLNNQSNWKLSSIVCNNLGLQASVVLAYMNDGCSINPVHIDIIDMGEVIPLSHSLIRKALKKLKVAGYIEIKLSGLPAKNYYSLTDKTVQLYNLISK